MPSAVEMSCFMDKVHLVSVGTCFSQYRRRCSQSCRPGPGLTVLKGLLCTLFCLLLVSQRRTDGCVCPPIHCVALGDCWWRGGKDSLLCSRNAFICACEFLGRGWQQCEALAGLRQSWSSSLRGGFHSLFSAVLLLNPKKPDPWKSGGLAAVLYLWPLRVAVLSLAPYGIIMGKISQYCFAVLNKVIACFHTEYL